MKNLCPRCLVGIDDDGDGNCGYCTSMSDTYVTVMVRRPKLTAMLEWIERAKQYLGAAYDNDCLEFKEGADFLRGPQ